VKENQRELIYGRV